MTLLLIVQSAFAAAMAWSCLCRAAKTDATTAREIRWVIVLQGIAAGLVLGAPVLPLLVPELHGRWQPGTTPGWVWLALLIAATLMQLVTAMLWRDGPPESFRREQA